MDNHSESMHQGLDPELPSRNEAVNGSILNWTCSQVILALHSDNIVVQNSQFSKTCLCGQLLISHAVN